MCELFVVSRDISMPGKQAEQFLRRKSFYVESLKPLRQTDLRRMTFNVSDGLLATYFDGPFWGVKKLRILYTRDNTRYAPR